jgi:hypothetical protein
LKVAEELEIKGLTEETDSSLTMESEATPSKKRRIAATPSNNRKASGSIKAENDNGPVEEENEQLGLAPMTDGRVTCLRCGKILSQINSARAHFLNIHETNKAEKNLKCKLCEKKFAVIKYMNQHMARFHGISPKLFKANYVPKFKPKPEPEQDDSES